MDRIIYRDWAGQLISGLKEAISKGQTSFQDATNDTSVRIPFRWMYLGYIPTYRHSAPGTWLSAPRPLGFRPQSGWQVPR